ncbi:ribonuclease H-like domain-containing protein, partial [Tanacetum coccineum]
FDLSFAKATSDESMLWHMRLGHINFKNINKLVKDNLVRGLPTKRFENYQTCVVCLKGKQHRASCKSKVFFLTTKVETSEILKNFIKEIENLVDKKVKIIRSDNGTEFKNKVMDDLCREKGFKDPAFQTKFSRCMVKALYGLLKDQELYETLLFRKSFSPKMGDADDVEYLVTKGFDAGRHVKRGRDTKIPQSSSPPIKVGDKAVHKELGDRMERAATTASSLEVVVPGAKIPYWGGVVDAQTRFETTSKQSNDPPLSRVNTLGSGEDNMKLMELMAHCTKLSELGTTMPSEQLMMEEVEYNCLAVMDMSRYITESISKKTLKLEESDGITSFTNTEILSNVCSYGVCVDFCLDLLFKWNNFLPSGGFSFIQSFTV